MLSRHGSTWINDITIVGQGIDTLFNKVDFLHSFELQPPKIKFPFHEYCRLRDCSHVTINVSTYASENEIMYTREIWADEDFEQNYILNQRECLVKAELNSRFASGKWKCQRENYSLNVTVMHEQLIQGVHNW